MTEATQSTTPSVHKPTAAAAIAAIVIAMLAGGYVTTMVPHDGATGAAGLNGLNGTSGHNGSTGAPGSPGFNGNTGSQGPPGSQGSPGSNGSQGPPGTDGNNGANGLNGTNGTDGSNGSSVPAITFNIDIHLNYSAAAYKACGYCLGGPWENGTVNYTTTEGAPFWFSFWLNNTNKTYTPTFQFMNISDGTFALLNGTTYGQNGAVGTHAPGAPTDRHMTYIMGVPYAPGTYTAVVYFCVS